MVLGEPSDPAKEGTYILGAFESLPSLYFLNFRRILENTFGRHQWSQVNDGLLKERGKLQSTFPESLEVPTPGIIGVLHTCWRRWSNHRDISGKVEDENPSCPTVKAVCCLCPVSITCCTLIQNIETISQSKISSILCKTFESLMGLLFNFLTSMHFRSSPDLFQTRTILKSMDYWPGWTIMSSIQQLIITHEAESLCWLYRYIKILQRCYSREFIRKM